MPKNDVMASGYAPSFPSLSIGRRNGDDETDGGDLRHDEGSSASAIVEYIEREFARKMRVDVVDSDQRVRLNR